MNVNGLNDLDAMKIFYKKFSRKYLLDKLSAKAVDEIEKSKNQTKREIKAAHRLATKDVLRTEKRQKQQERRARASLLRINEKLNSELEKHSEPDMIIQTKSKLEERKNGKANKGANDIKNGGLVNEFEGDPATVETYEDMLDGIKQRKCRGYVFFDTAFDALMFQKEKSSLVAQVARCHGLNKKSENFYNLVIGPVSGSFSMFLEKYSAFRWQNVSFFHRSDSDEEQEESHSFLDESQMESHDNDDRNLKIVYLSADADRILTDAEMNDPSICLVIGALVDRNRHKGAGVDRAQSLGLSVARLPIQESGFSLLSSTVLTVNQVFEILLNYWTDGSWVNAFSSSIPTRKISANCK